MAYDGKTRLNLAVADLIGCSPQNNNKLAKVIGQAKSNLGITSKARKLSPGINQQIYSHLVKIYSQPTNNAPVEITSQEHEPVTAEKEQTPQVPVELYSQDSGPTPPKSESLHRSTVEIISQPDNNESVELFSHTNNFTNVRIAFYIVRKGKRERQVIALDGFLINALASIGISKQDAPQWVQAQVNAWTAFDSKLPITRQVKYLIMREVVKSLSGSDEFFHAPIYD